MKKIANFLLENDNYYIFPHVSLDGDALGSSIALCRGLEKLGKNAKILYRDNIPDFISFLDYGVIKDEVEGEYISIAIDWSSLGRVEDRKEEFQGGKEKVCIDHHICDETFTEFSYIDPSRAATGELIFELLKLMEVEFDVDIATAIYVAIILDSGNFQYSNCTPSTHYIAGELLALGVNQNEIYSRLYESKSKEQISIEAFIASNIRYHLNGRVAIGSVSIEDMKKRNAKYSDSEGAIDVIRSIYGVDIACLIKEYEKGVCKLSLRAKGDHTVMKLANSFNGGGHLKAAGATINGSVEEVYNMLVDRINQIYG